MTRCTNASEGQWPRLWSVSLPGMRLTTCAEIKSEFECQPPRPRREALSL